MLALFVLQASFPPLLSCGHPATPPTHTHPPTRPPARPSLTPRFYVPVLFSSLGSGKSAALLNAVIIGAVNLVATFVSIMLVDRSGRRILFMEGGVQMMLAQVRAGVAAGGGRRWGVGAHPPRAVASRRFVAGALACALCPPPSPPPS